MWVGYGSSSYQDWEQADINRACPAFLKNVCLKTCMTRKPNHSCRQVGCPVKVGLHLPYVESPQELLISIQQTYGPIATHKLKPEPF